MIKKLISIAVLGFIDKSINAPFGINEPNPSSVNHGLDLSDLISKKSNTERWKRAATVLGSVEKKEFFRTRIRNSTKCVCSCVPKSEFGLNFLTSKPNKLILSAGEARSGQNLGMSFSIQLRFNSEALDRVYFNHGSDVRARNQTRKNDHKPGLARNSRKLAAASKLKKDTFFGETS